MSVRQRLKKDIYKAKQEGKDISLLEKRLSKMVFTTEQKIQQITVRMADIYHYIEDNHYSSEVIDETIKELNQLHLDLRPLRESIHLDPWTLPYPIKRALRDRSGYDLADNIEKRYSKEEPEMTLLENSRLKRWILISVNGKETRINVETKKRFVDRNWYWFKYKFCKKTYTNCLKNIY